MNTQPSEDKPEPVAWRCRLRPDGAWTRLDAEWVEKRSADPDMEVQPLYAHPLPSSGWQPIETAPDRTDILVCATHSLGDGEWETLYWVDSLVDGWWHLYPRRIDLPFPPTDWMPLPAPPSQDNNRKHGGDEGEAGVDQSPPIVPGVREAVERGLSIGTLSYCYALLGASCPAEVATIWEDNPEPRKTAHAEIAALNALRGSGHE